MYREFLERINFDSLRRAENVENKFVGIKNKLDRKIVLRNSWKKFIKVTTIGGLRRFTGLNYQPFSLSCWATMIFWFTSLGLCSWSSLRILQRYMKHEVKTQTTFQIKSDIKFPAITLCNQNVFRKSVVGGSYSLSYGMAEYFAVYDEEVATMITNNNRTCFLNPKTKLAQEMDADPYYYIGGSFLRDMTKSAMGYSQSVVECWWQNKVGCKDHLINRLSDFGEEESFNVFTTAATIGDDYPTRKIGIQNGLALLLNTSQNDYCGATRMYQGAGYIAQIHDAKYEPSFLLDPSLRFSPGYDYSVVIKPVTFKRKTEHLGLCKNFVPLTLFPEVTVYSRKMCFFQCYFLTMWEQCRCLFFAFANERQLFSELLNLPLKNFTVCYGHTMNRCSANVRQNFLNGKKQGKEVCPLCAVPCLEVHYNVQISQSRLSTRNVLKQARNHLDANAEYVRENYTLVNFYFEDYSDEFVIETQSFTFIDLLIYSESRFCLFFGMSALSFVEISYQLIISLQIFIETFLYRMRENIIFTI